MFWNILIGTVFFVSSVNAADNALDEYLSDLQSLQGEFVQSVYDEQGLALENSRGHFSLQRPGKFNWQYMSPYQQLIVANGENIWIYEEDLAQVTRKAYKPALANTPVLLFTDQKALSEHFTIRSLDSAIGSQMQRFELKAKNPDSSFQTMIVGLENKTLRLLELEDNLGQRTEIHLSAQIQNQALDPILFDFVIPAGVDVIDDQ